MINMPTQDQMDQSVKNAVEVLAEELNTTVKDVLENNSEQVFQLVCAYAAQEC